MFTSDGLGQAVDTLANKTEYLLVDGYNIIFAWDSLKKTSEYSLENARKELLEVLSDYQGFKQNEIIVVFDAHKIKGNIGTTEKYNNISVVYTKEAETADNYIEKVTKALTKDNIVYVATSDNTEQIIVLGKGANRISARGLFGEIKAAQKAMREDFIEKPMPKKNLLFDNLDEKTKKLLDKMIRGE